MTRIFHSLPIRIGIEMGQPHIQPDGFACWFSLFNPLNIEAKLGIIPIRTTHNPDSLNLLQLIEMQITSPPKLETPCFETIGKRDRTSIFRKLPATRLVFNSAMCLMLLK